VLELNPVFGRRCLLRADSDLRKINDTLATINHLANRFRRRYFVFCERINKKTKIRFVSCARHDTFSARSPQKKHLHNGTTAGNTVFTYYAPYGLDLAIDRTRFWNLQEFSNAANTVVKTGRWSDIQNRRMSRTPMHDAEHVKRWVDNGSFFSSTICAECRWKSCGHEMLRLSYAGSICRYRYWCAISSVLGPLVWLWVQTVSCLLDIVSPKKCN